MGYDHASDIEPDLPERIDQAQHIEIICNAEIPSSFTFLYVIRAYGNNDLGFILKLHQHFYLAVGFESRKHS